MTKVLDTRFLGYMVGAAVIGFALAVVSWWSADSHDDIAAVRGAAGGIAGNEVLRFESLPEMTDRTDLIVEGRITRVEPGREFAGPPRAYYVTGYLEVQRILKGKSETEEVAVEFFAGDGSRMQEFMTSLQGIEGLWFLLDKREEAIRLGLSGDLVDRETGFHMLVSSQGLVAEQSGLAVNVFARREQDIAPLIDATDGLPYEAVAARVRQLAESSP